MECNSNWWYYKRYHWFVQHYCSGTDFATKGRAATEEQLKAATEATTLKFTGDVATNTDL